LYLILSNFIYRVLFLGLIDPIFQSYLVPIFNARNTLKISIWLLSLLLEVVVLLTPFFDIITSTLASTVFHPTAPIHPVLRHCCGWQHLRSGRCNAALYNNAWACGLRPCWPHRMAVSKLFDKLVYLNCQPVWVVRVGFRHVVVFVFTCSCYSCFRRDRINYRAVLRTFAYL